MARLPFSETMIHLMAESFEFYCRFDFNTKWLDPYKEKFGLKY